jgi:hypothetical protein
MMRESGRLFYCLKWVTWDMVGYWILSKGEMEPKHYEGSVGPFRSVKAACQWALSDVQTHYPQAYERRLKKGPIEFSGRGLTVDTTPEFILEMLRTDIDLERLPEDERKMRQGYLSDAEEMKALYEKLCS